MTPHPLSGQEILFTRQRHDAKRAGLHYDYRLVLGDKAYSWATKKETPQPGSAIILFEQPVHDRTYALSERVEIPEGSYGHGVTTLDWVRKAKIDAETEEGKLVINSGKERFLLKKLDPVKYGEKSWLFKNLTMPFGYTRQKLASVNPEIESKFKPDFTPSEMQALGVLRHKGSQYGEGVDKDNFFGVRASLDTWPDKWHNEQHPQGWFQWYRGYVASKRTSDDERQMRRWISFKARHLAQLKKADPDLSNLNIQPKRRQALLNWGIDTGIDRNKYLVKVAEQAKKKNSSWNGFGPTIAGTMLGGVFATPLSLGAMALGAHTMGKIREPNPTVADRHTVKHFMRANNLHAHTRFAKHDSPLADALGTKGGPAYIDKRVAKTISKVLRSAKPHLAKTNLVSGLRGAGVNHEITMHELGHAKDFNTGARTLKRGLSLAKAPMAAGSGLLTMGLLSNKKTEDYAPLASAIPAAITLREEAAANHHAYQGIKAHKGKLAANKYLTRTVPGQMGHYALAVGAPVAAAYVAKKIIQKINE